MNDEDYEEQDDTEDDEGGSLILSVGDNGKAEIYKPEDFVEMKKEEAELLKDFIDENKDLFDKFVKKRKPNTSKR